MITDVEFKSDQELLSFIEFWTEIDSAQSANLPTPEGAPPYKLVTLFGAIYGDAHSIEKLVTLTDFIKNHPQIEFIDSETIVNDSKEVLMCRIYYKLNI